MRKASESRSKSTQKFCARHSFPSRDKKNSCKKDRSKTITQTDTGVKVQISNSLVWCLDGFWLMFTLSDSIARMTKIEKRYWIDTDSFIHSSIPKKLIQLLAHKEHLFVMYMLHIRKKNYRKTKSTHYHK